MSISEFCVLLPINHHHNAMNTIISEVTPLGDRDCFYLVDRYKDQFNYPIHRHNEYELNFVANCRGARRVVGDSFEVLGDYDLALLGGGIEHTWEQHECSSVPIREITIQFSRHLFGDTFLSKSYFCQYVGCSSRATVA